jgi:hypothetical protein
VLAPNRTAHRGSSRLQISSVRVAFMTGISDSLDWPYWVNVPDISRYRAV